VLTAQRRHRAQHTAAGEAAAAKVAACLDSLQAEAQVRPAHASRSRSCPGVPALQLVPQHVPWLIRPTVLTGC
jgi:hypothetical protein